MHRCEKRGRGCAALVARVSDSIVCAHHSIATGGARAEHVDVAVRRADSLSTAPRNGMISRWCYLRIHISHFIYAPSEPVQSVARTRAARSFSQLHPHARPARASSHTCVPIVRTKTNRRRSHRAHARTHTKRPPHKHTIHTFCPPRRPKRNSRSHRRAIPDRCGPLTLSPQSPSAAKAHCGCDVGE